MPDRDEARGLDRRSPLDEARAMRTRTCACQLDPRGFVRVTVDDLAEMTKDDARDALEAIVRVAGPERARTLVDMRNIKSITRDGREHFRAATSSVCSRVAMLVRSPVGRVIGNFFLRTLTTGMPKRIFNDEADAARWLLSEQP
jgi:hypothetical protein